MGGFYIAGLLILIGQVLTQEDWNTVLYNGMETTSSWASLYFIALMTLGNYVLFNLLVAILVEGFSTEVKKKMKKTIQVSVKIYLITVICFSIVDL